MGIRHTFIQNLKYYRKQAGLTQEKLAEAIGMSTSYIGDMEARERFPSAETIDKIANALNVKTQILFYENNCPENVITNFKNSYSATFHDELVSQVIKAIDDVCEKMKNQ